MFIVALNIIPGLQKGRKCIDRISFRENLNGQNKDHLLVRIEGLFLELELSGYTFWKESWEAAKQAEPSKMTFKVENRPLDGSFLFFEGSIVPFGHFAYFANNRPGIELLS